MTSKVIFITGASSGFGKQMALHLSSLGYRVFGTGLEAEHTIGDVPVFQMDINDQVSVEKAVAKVIAQAGCIDVLVNNAGFGICGAVEDTSIEEARRQMETNFFGHVRVLQEVLPHMRKRGSGRLINVSSLAGRVALPYQPFYSASKHAIEGMTRSLRIELTGSGIDCTLIEPGDFNTGFTAARVPARPGRAFTRSAWSALLPFTRGTRRRARIPGYWPSWSQNWCKKSG